MENRKNTIYRVVMLVIITVIITFMITSIGMYNYFVETGNINIEKLVKQVEVSEETESLNKKIEIVKKYLEKYYIGELDSESMQEIAIKGYVAGLNDEYTEYLTKEEYEELLVAVNGDYVGIGIYMYQDSNGNIVVLMPMEDSPAQEAGVQANDIIVSINGELCTELSIDEAAAKIKGEENTTVQIEILRGNERIIKTIQRRTVEIPDSRAEVLEGNIGYIELTTFDNKSTDNVSKYLADFKSKGINSAIIDLRNNTGGMVTEAVSFSELFVEDGNVIMRSYNKKDKETIVKANNKETIDMNLVILVNEYSASATEIVAAALKDNGVAKIVGTQTYGKGVMQEVVPLFEGALKLTIEEFKTPNGEKINGVGITPDIVIEDNSQTVADEQLQKALEILK